MIKVFRVIGWALVTLGTAVIIFGFLYLMWNWIR